MDFDKIQNEAKRPYSPRTKKDPPKIDPEKFKKIMKVEDSQEAQKRKKRSLPEEEEEEVHPKESNRPPSTSFSDYMDDTPPLSSVFDKESGGVRMEIIDENSPSVLPYSSHTEPLVERFHPSVETPSSSSPNPLEKGVNQPPLLSSPPSSEKNQPPFSSSTSTQSDHPISSSAQETPPHSSAEKDASLSEQNTQIEEDPPPPKKRERAKQKKPETDSSLLASQPKTKNLAALKKKKKKGKEVKVKRVVQKNSSSEGKKETKGPSFSKESSLEKTPFPLADEPIVLRSAKDKNEKPLDVAKKGEAPFQGFIDEASQKLDERPTKKEKKGAFFHRLTFEENRDRQVRRQKIKESAPPFSVEHPSIHQEKKEKKETGFPEATSKTAGIPLPPPCLISFSNPPLAEMASCTKLSPSVFALFEKMSACLIIQQEKGMSTTTLNISMPGSVFNETQVMIKQYSTAPNAYHIQLIGNPKSVQIFSENLDLLQKSFIEGRFGFEVQILNPILATEKKSPHLIRRKGKSSGQEGKEEK